MANSSFICHQLIDDIIKRGGQHISDRFIVKKCLDKVVLSNKKFIVNELVKQTGIKSEHCTINYEMCPQKQPKIIPKDEYMAKSILRQQNSKKRAKSLATCQPKCFSNSKDTKRQVKNQSNQKVKKFMMTGSTFKSEMKQTHRNNYFIDLQSQQQKQIKKISLKQQTLFDTMRQQILAQQKMTKQLQLQNTEREQKDMAKILKTKRNFEKQLNDGAKEHTYHTDGKYIIFSSANRYKALNQNFPICMKSSVSLQKNSKKKKKLQKGLSNLQLKSKQQILLQSCKLSRSSKIQPQRKSSAQLKSQIYNNNNQRQTSSIDFMNAKPGICFTETSQGKTIRGDPQQNSQTTINRNKKSNFSKFLTKTSKIVKTEQMQSLKLDSNIGYKILDIKSRPVKTEHKPDYEYFEQRISHTYSRRPKTSKPSGAITNVNQSLRSKLISML